MKLRRIKIGRYKNLKDFECEFGDSNISAFIGDNGSGKSNLLEAVTSAFSYAKNNVTKKRFAAYSVTSQIENSEIEYELNNNIYTLRRNGLETSIRCGEKNLTKNEMTEALPSAIMLYYAGETKRLEYTASNTIDDRYDNYLKGTDNEGFPGFKFIDYYSVKDLNLLLLVAAVYQGDYCGELLNLLNCSEISPEIEITLKDPKKKKNNADTYWGAVGFVKSFLDSIKRYANKTEDLSQIYVMKFNNISEIMPTSHGEGNLFAKFKALSNAGYLQSIDVFLKNREGEKFRSSQLSEGEKQLALLLLLTSFTASDDFLYVFDEFDAYLHMNWQRKFVEMLDDVNVNGHVLFTTHSASTVSKIKSDELFMMVNGQVEYPRYETYNRALDEIMREQMGVGMRDAEIENLYNRFKQAIADRNKIEAEHLSSKIKEYLSENDPMILKMDLVLRRIK